MVYMDSLVSFLSSNIVGGPPPPPPPPDKIGPNFQGLLYGTRNDIGQGIHPGRRRGTFLAGAFFGHCMTVSQLIGTW